MLNKAVFYYLSPTGGTKKCGEIFCSALAEETVLMDLAFPGQLPEAEGEELTVVAAPVFGGRIPALMAERLKSLKLDGKGKKAVTLAVYGNRHYDDALAELNALMTEAGFTVIASGAVIAQHSIVPALAAGRPDSVDIESLKTFAGEVLKKLENGTEESVVVPGAFPSEREFKKAAAPLSSEGCTGCGSCKDVCPSQAITIEDGTVHTDFDACILCMACVAACPEHGRVLPAPVQERMDQFLGAFIDKRRENEYFL